MIANEALLEHVSALRIFDTHTHMWPFEKDQLDQDVLAEYLMHYLSSDLVSAGLPVDDLARARDSSMDLLGRWRLVEPYWQACRHTGYARALDIAARDLYGIVGGICGKTIVELNEKFRAVRSAGKTGTGSWYQHVLKERSRITTSLRDGELELVDERFFRTSLQVSRLVGLGSLLHPQALARMLDIPAMRHLEDVEEAVELYVDRGLAQGAVCLKSVLAYQRSLRFDRPAIEEARREWTLVLHSGGEDGWQPFPMDALPHLQDHLMHCVCRVAQARGLVIQVHTGLQEGHGNDIRRADPTLLCNLFLQYPGARFDLFHIGYPYQGMLSALAKNFANVYIDFAWAHIISPTASVAALVEYLDAVPANKIHGFGNDYCFPDGVYGHAVLARQNVARALATKIDQGIIDLDEAKQLATAILRTNAEKTFALG